MLAKGLTPVDWSGFLIQQRRWARSVLDVKFRIYPKVARNLPLRERLANFVHGLYYLESVGVGLQVVLLAFMLCSGSTPHVFSFFTLPGFALVVIVLQSCEFYRQRFFLDPQREMGLHWRSQVLAYAKWPIFLLALYDVITLHRGPYTITRKAGTASRRPSILLVPHFLILSLVGSAWVGGMILGHIQNPFLHVGAAFIVLCSLRLMLTTRLKFPHPYDSKLRAKAR